MGATIKHATVGALAKREMETADHFVRDHFGVPEKVVASLTIDVAGAPVSLSFADLHARADRELSVVLECAGHRRSEYVPEAPGVPWQVGAISEARWFGVPLASLLGDLPEGCREIIAAGSDAGEVASGGVAPFARSIPIEKALHRDTLVAVAMNGDLIPVEHGGPIRLIVPGWYATDSVKWLRLLRASAEPFDGHFQARDYRFRMRDEEGAGDRMTTLLPHSIITSKNARVVDGFCHVEGIAWGGEDGIVSVDVRVDGGEWRRASIEKPAHPYGRAFWHCRVRAGGDQLQLEVRATDATGAQQPAVATWNEKGYRNNSIQRVTLDVER